MNYTELYNTIQTYTENQFPDVYLASGATVSATTQINMFITQAEQRIYNSVQFPSLAQEPIHRNHCKQQVHIFAKRFSCLLFFGVGNRCYWRNLDTGTFEYLLNKDVNFIRQAYPTPNDTGVPKYYALFGPTIVSSAITNELSLILGPTPDAAYYVELHYYYYPESITTAGNHVVGRQL
jgi:hypothetical protein